MSYGVDVMGWNMDELKLKLKLRCGAFSSDPAGRGIAPPPFRGVEVIGKRSDRWVVGGGGSMYVSGGSSGPLKTVNLVGGGCVTAWAAPFVSDDSTVG